MKERGLIFQVMLFLAVLPAISANSTLISGQISINLDLSFKPESAQFFDSYLEVATTVNGRIYVACNRKHSILIFDTNGKKIGKFGQKGQGPGDLLFPHRLSILDGKYLVVGEMASNRRVSLFDLEGKFIKIIRTERPAFSPIALQNNKIAYLAKKGSQDKKQSSAVRLVIVKDLNTGVEEIVREFTVADKGNVWLPNGALFKVGNFIGDVFIAKNSEGNLVFGNSQDSTLYIYNPSTQQSMPPITINIQPTEVTSHYIKAFKERYFKNMAQSYPPNHPAYPMIRKKLESLSFDKFFASHLPYYSDILTNPKGEIVLIRMDDPMGTGKARLLTIRNNGAEQQDSIIETKDFVWPVNSRFKNFSFYKDNIAFALVKDSGQEDEVYSLKKLNITNTTP